jgi:thymidylate synthase ThyX
MTDCLIEIVAASAHPDPVGGVMFTIAGRLPTIGLAQLNTHGWFARSAASMRAIPTAKLLESVETDPYIPEFGSNQRGMVAGAPVEDPRCEAIHRDGLAAAIQLVRQMAHLGVHKEVVNRYLTPWSWTRVVVTGRGEAWANFLALRNHPTAFPPLRDFARQAGLALRGATPRALALGEWHLPYVPSGRASNGGLSQSVARCARTSYRSFDAPERESTLAEDEALVEKLLGSTPMHASPAEHQAKAVDPYCWNAGYGGRAGVGWSVYRKTLKHEVETDLTAELKRLG